MHGMKKEHLAELRVGPAIAIDTVPPNVHASTKMPTYDARVRMCVGLAAGIAGAMARCTSKTDAIMALRAAIDAAENLP